ncbi:MAG: putative metal-binding motif-containing protein [Nitrospirota bacterium]
MCVNELFQSYTEFTYDSTSDTFTGQLPDGTSVTFYGTPQPQCVDNDGDGHYAPTATCPQGDDCDDNVYDPTVYYGAPELCDGKDNNYDGYIDEGCYEDDRTKAFKEMDEKWNTLSYEDRADIVKNTE